MAGLQGRYYETWVPKAADLAEYETKFDRELQQLLAGNLAVGSEVSSSPWKNGDDSDGDTGSEFARLTPNDGDSSGGSQLELPSNERSLVAA